MKKIIFLGTLYLMISLGGVAQSKMNLLLLNKVREAQANNRSQAIDVLIKGDINSIKKLVLTSGGIFKYSSGNIAAVNLSLYQLGEIATNKAIQRIEAYPSHVQILNDSTLVNSNVIPVHNGQLPLTQAYDGTGVVVGFIDTGIDFHHPDFKDNSGKMRIKYIWDHNLPVATNTPAAYGYGQEFTSTDIDKGLAEKHTDTVQFRGHGTHVAGVGVGNGRAVGDYKGVAPGADIIMVALNFNNASAVDAVEYIYSKAQAMGKPCVINASFGDYFGSHDGQDLQAQLISNLIDEQSGRVFVAAAGNAGNNPFHLGYTVTSDTNFTLFNEGTSAVYIQMWADTSDFKNVEFSIGADKMTPFHSFRGRLPFSNIISHLGKFKEDTLFNNGRRIGRIQSYGDLIGGTYSMEFNIISDSTNYFWRLITTGSGKFDLWDYAAVASSLPSMPDAAYYKYPDVNQTIVSSFQCLDNVITVANYVDRRSYQSYYDTLFVNTALVPGKRAASSSNGPTRDGRIKPDIAAPGDMTIAAVVLTIAPSIIASNPAAIAKGGFHVRDGGTSNASPVIAGVAALYLQKNPTASAMEIKQAMISCTIKDVFTGNSLPDSKWGYGKVNAYGALTGCYLANIKDGGLDKQLVVIYPNPSLSENTFTISVSNITVADKAVLKICNALGAIVKTISVNNTTTQITTELTAGIYFCGLEMNGRLVGTQKLVVY